MAPVPLQPSAQDEEKPRIFPWALLEQAGQGGCTAMHHRNGACSNRSRFRPDWSLGKTMSETAVNETLTLAKGAAIREH
jgi:hypothetical protein